MATYAELQAKITELQKQAAEAKEEERSGALHRIQQTMEVHGLTLEDIAKKLKAPRKSWTKKESNVLYRDPESGKTWGGRGRVPTWLAGDREQYRVAA